MKTFEKELPFIYKAVTSNPGDLIKDPHSDVSSSVNPEFASLHCKTVSTEA